VKNNVMNNSKERDVMCRMGYKKVTLSGKKGVAVCRHAGGQHSVLSRGAAVTARSIMWAVTVVTHVRALGSTRGDLHIAEHRVRDTMSR
jgi:hypothetical protein